MSFLRRLLVLGLLAAFCGCHSSGVNSYYIPYIEKTAGLLLPPGLNVISEFDAGELELGGKYVLSKSGIASFMKAYPFQVIDAGFDAESHYNFFNPRHPIPLSDSSRLKYFIGRHKGNSWIFTLDEKTGELWIEVRYGSFIAQEPA